MATEYSTIVLRGITLAVSLLERECEILTDEISLLHQLPNSGRDRQQLTNKRSAHQQSIELLQEQLNRLNGNY